MTSDSMRIPVAVSEGIGVRELDPNEYDHFTDELGSACQRLLDRVMRWLNDPKADPETPFDLNRVEAGRAHRGREAGGVG